MGAGGPLNSFFESVEWMRFESATDVEEYLRRLRDVPNTLQAYISTMDQGIERGFTASLAMVRDVEAQLAGIISGPLAELTAPLEALSPEAVPLDSPLRAEVAGAVEDIRAAFREFLSYLKGTYFPNCRENPSCSALPNGQTLYEKCLR